MTKCKEKEAEHGEEHLSLCWGWLEWIGGDTGSYT